MAQIEVFDSDFHRNKLNKFKYALPDKKGLTIVNFHGGTRYEVAVSSQKRRNESSF